MNSVAIVESPAGENRLHYIATLISNVLYKNSAVDHQTLGTRIHRLVEASHPLPQAAPGSLPAAMTFGEHLIGYEDKRKERMLVVNTQTALSKLGYSVGGVDGKMGPNTRNAIKQFQKAENLNRDGKISVALLERLNKVIASQDASVLESPVTVGE